MPYNYLAIQTLVNYSVLTAYEAAILEMGDPAIWIRASETSGGVLADSSGHNRDLIISGVPALGVAGLGDNTGLALTADGATVNLLRTTGNELFVKGGITYTLVNVNSAGEGNVAAFSYWGTGINNGGLWFNLAMNQLAFRYETQSPYALTITRTSTGLIAGTTYHLFSGIDPATGLARIWWSTLQGTVTEFAYVVQPAKIGTEQAYTSWAAFSNSGSSRTQDGTMDEIVHWNDVDITDPVPMQAIVDAVGIPNVSGFDSGFDAGFGS